MPDVGRPAGAAVTIALCDLPTEGLDDWIEHGLSQLPSALHAEILRFRRREDRLSRIIARLLLRAVLLKCGLSGHAHLGGWQRSAQGRPSLDACRADFSISHSGTWTAVAVGQDLRIGLDVEQYRHVDSEVFGSILTSDERMRLASSTHPEEEAIHCWCLREAVLKAHGTGLLIEDAELRAIGMGRFPGGQRWIVRRIGLVRGCCFLAASHDVTRLRMQWLPIGDL